MRVEDVLCSESESQVLDLTRLSKAMASREAFPLHAADKAALAELVLNMSVANAAHEPSCSIPCAIRDIEAELHARRA